MAKIGIDARLWGVKHTGIGRYTKMLIENLQSLGDDNEYVLFCRKETINEIPTVVGWRKILADIPHYSISEQVTLQQIFLKENLDLLHVPHFNVPVFYPKPFVITVHDILWHSKKGLDVTTLPPLTYLAKYAAYRLVVKMAVTRSKAIFVPSTAVLDELSKRYASAKNKTKVTYEGVDPLTTKKVASEKGRYLLYVGNLYPHKNVEVLLKALAQNDSLPRLKVVSGRNAFQEKAQKLAKKHNVENRVEFLGHVSDTKLASLYQGTEAFIFPTLSEGFGLPGLEAMSLGAPVVCSNIPVLKEVYQNAALYFDPQNPSELAEQILALSNKKKREVQIKRGLLQVKKYSWKKMAIQTLEVYKEILK